MLRKINRQCTARQNRAAEPCVDLLKTPKPLTLPADFPKNMVPYPPSTLHLRKSRFDGFPKRYNIPLPKEHHILRNQVTWQKPQLVDAFDPPPPPVKTPIYTYTYVYTHTHTHTYIYIYTHTHTMMTQ